MATEFPGIEMLDEQPIPTVEEEEGKDDNEETAALQHQKKMQAWELPEKNENNEREGYNNLEADPNE